MKGSEMILDVGFQTEGMYMSAEEFHLIHDNCRNGLHTRILDVQGRWLVNSIIGTDMGYDLWKVDIYAKSYQ